MARPFFTSTAPTTGFGCARPMPCRASSSACAIQSLSASVTLIEERIDVGFGVKWHQIVHLFTRANEANGQVEIPGDCHDNAALGRAVQFGQHNSGHSGAVPEFTGLVQAVLPRRRIEHE